MLPVSITTGSCFHSKVQQNVIIRVVVLDLGQATHVDQFTPTANKVLPAHCLSVKGLWVVVGEEMEREGVINREIKRDGARITQRLIVG